jgi:hypothetical protein
MITGVLGSGKRWVSIVSPPERYRFDRPPAVALTRLVWGLRREREGHRATPPKKPDELVITGELVETL